MPSYPADSGSPRHSASLLLRVRRPDGRSDEFYLAPGLTIGRTLANTIALPDDSAVDRTHARVEIASDGSAILRCVEPGSSLTVRGTAFRKVMLEPGIRFRIGRTDFECISGQQGADQSTATTLAACPFCASTNVPTGGEAARPCPNCHELVLPVRLDSGVPEHILVPVIYGKYRAEHYIARGGMGLVFKGVREGTGETVAIKVVLPGTFANRRDADRFVKEGAAMARVRHPNVVKLLDHGQAGEYPFSFLVLEWIDGPSLRQVIADAERVKKLPDFAVAFRWFRHVCKGLAAIHEVGLIHRDLKPSNILIGTDGRAKIADFGIAKPVDAAQNDSTKTDHVLGTYAYIAPEQWTAPDTLDGRADLYALGVMFYELLTGSLPVGNWPPAAAVNPTVPADFDAILGRLLAPIPQHRYARARDILRPTEDQAPRTSEADSHGIAGGAGRGTRSAWWMAGPLFIKGALVGAVAGAIAATCIGGSAIVGALVGCLPGALGAHLGMRPGSEPDRPSTETSPCGDRP